MINNKFTKNDIGSIVELIDDYCGLSKGSIGTILNVHSTEIVIDHISGYITDYCDYHNSYACDCNDKNLWENECYDFDCMYIGFNYVKIISDSNNKNNRESNLLLLI